MAGVNSETGMAGATITGGAGTSAEAKGTSLDMYELVQVIGKGSFGTVSKIRRKADGRVRKKNEKKV